MTTVQLAIADSECARSLRSLLLRDGTHRVLLVDRPDLTLDGVVVIDGARLGHHSLLASQPERFVVITSRNVDLKRIWDAGVWHVVFEGDSPNTALLAVIAAELRLMVKPVQAPVARQTGAGAHRSSRAEKYRAFPSPNHSSPPLPHSRPQ